MSTNKHLLSRVSVALLAALFMSLNVGSTVHALTFSAIQDSINYKPWYDKNDTLSGCSGSGGGATTVGGGNLDYAGHPILTQGQLAAIKKNQSTYEEAAQKVSIPWQMLAVVHLRESGLKVANPSNGQGIYQFYDRHGGPYPGGPVSQAEFLRQSILAAQFLKSIASGNYAGNKDLSVDSSAETIKDTFFSYNGRASAYEQQAARLGYDAHTQGYEGSPYVMNKADAKRDPAVNKTTWGQIKTDGGSIEYPANDDYGAFVTFAAITGGVSSSGSCLSSSGTVDCNSPSNAAAGLSPTRQNVVCIAEQELALWTSGKLKPGVQGGYGKYSEGRRELWCADFSSWVYDQAKYPLHPDPGWNVPAVATIRSIGEAGGKFHWHSVGSGYIPRPGDLIIHQNGESHVNLVVGVKGSQITQLGGDQSPDSRGYPDGSRVSKYTESHDGTISGYVSPD